MKEKRLMHSLLDTGHTGTENNTDAICNTCLKRKI